MTIATTRTEHTVATLRQMAARSGDAAVMQQLPALR